MKLVYGFIFVVFWMASSIHATPFLSCQIGPPPEELRINGCNSTPCSFARGRHIIAEWDFIIRNNTKVLKPKVRAIVGGRPTEFPFPQKDACLGLKNVKCPLVNGQKVTFQLDFPVLRFYPKVSTTLEFSFYDDNNKIVVCYVIPIKVI